MLLSKANLLSARAASTDETRPALRGLHVDPKRGYTEATDGHILVRVKLPDQKAEDYPHTPTLPSGPVMPTEPVIIDRQACLDAAKNIPKFRTLPVLSHAALGTVNGTVPLVTTDLDREKVVNGKPVEGPYPNCDNVLPSEKPTFTIAFDLDLLADLIAALKPCYYSDGPVKTARFDFYTPTSAAVVRVPRSAETQACAVIMPLRDSKDSEYLDIKTMEPVISQPAQS